MLPAIETHNGVTYWRERSACLEYATRNGLPTDRLIAYGRGYAIQKRISGPYWDAVKRKWQ